MPTSVVLDACVLQFADAEQKLMATERSGGPRIPMTVKRACRESGFYDIDIDPAYSSLAPRNQIELSLADFEGRASRLFDRFATGDATLSEQGRFDLMLFLSFQAVRGWSFRQELSELCTLMAKQELEGHLTTEYLREQLRTDGRPYDDASIAAWRDEILTSNWKLVPPPSVAVQQMALLALNVMHPDFYFRRRVQLRRFAEPSLLVSDEPVAMWSSPDRDLRAYPLGIASADVLYMPIDRHHALALTLSGPEGIVDAVPEEAALINRLIATNSHRWIFQHPADPPLNASDLAEPRQWTVETLGVIVEDDKIRVQKQVVRRQPE